MLQTIRIAGCVKESIVDGPAVRYTVFTQGCKHNCKGCHNPSTHNMRGGKEETIDNLVADILKQTYISGVTLSGGDPFFQASASASLAKKLKEKGIHIVCYTGFTFDELYKSQDIGKQTLLNNIDILIDGRYIEEQRDLRLLFRGSRNQRIIDVKKSLIAKRVVTANVNTNDAYSENYEIAINVG